MCRVLSVAVLVVLHVALACSADSAPARSTTRPTTSPAGAAKPVAVKDIALRDVEGVERKPLDAEASRAKAAVVCFLSHDCPISNSYAPEISRITFAYGGEGKFSFSIAHPYAELSAAEARKH